LNRKEQKKQYATVESHHGSPLALTNTSSPGEYGPWV